MSPKKDQTVAGKYRLREPLARGGMGAVWVARHVELDVDVAIKFRTSPEELDASTVDRFRREAQAAARLKSAHVVHIHDYGVDDSIGYIAMELLEGEDLGDLLDREERLSLGRTADLVAQAAKGLECAHDAGIVHRDIKPRNLFLARQGGDEILKILDFGIAKDTIGASDEGGTSTNVILGSPTYMSPEQARGLKLDPSSDVWSLAAVAYRALTGEPPFVGVNSQDTVIKICTEQAELPTRRCPDLPAELDTFFERALARDPKERFESPGELSKALLGVAKGHPDHRAPEARSVPKGRSTPTETLAAGTSAPEPETVSSPWPRGTLVAGAALALIVAYGLLSRTPATPKEASRPASPATATPTAKRPEPSGTRAQVEPATEARTPATVSASEAPTASHALAPRPSPTQARSETKRTSTPPPKPPKPDRSKRPKVDPVFGLPVAPDASSGH